MPLLLRQQIDSDGLSVVPIPERVLTHIVAGSFAYDSADVAGDTFDNDGKTVLHVKNGSPGPHTVTVGGRSKVIGARSEGFLGPFPTREFGATAAITYSGVTSLTLAVVAI